MWQPYKKGIKSILTLPRQLELKYRYLATFAGHAQDITQLMITNRNVIVRKLLSKKEAAPLLKRHVLIFFP